MKNKHPFPLCGSFLCAWILSSTYLICLSSFLGLILVFSANFCLKAVLQSPHHTYNNLLDCLWLNQPCMALKPGHTPPFEPLQAEELLCTLVSPETIWHIFLFIWQWSQLVFHSDPSPSLQNCFLTISSSSCAAAHCSFNNFHLSFLEKHRIILRWCYLLGFFWILSIVQRIDSPIQLGIVFPLIIYSLFHYPGYSWICLPDPGQIPEGPTKIYAAIFLHWTIGSISPDMIL